MARGLRRHPPHPIFHRPTQIQNGPTTVGNSFTADSVINREQTGSFTVDADISARVLTPRNGLYSWGWRPRKRIRPQVNGRSVPAPVGAVTVEGSFTADAVIKAEETGLFTVDSIVKREITGSFTADADITIRSSPRQGLYAWGWRAKKPHAPQVPRRRYPPVSAGPVEQNGSFTADAIILKTQVFEAAAGNVTFRDVSSNSDTATASAVGNLPAGTVDGDLLIASVMTTSSSTTVSSVPGGWNVLNADPNPADFSVLTYYKFASSEPSTWTWTLSVGTDTWRVDVLAYAGVDALPVVGTNIIAAASTISLPLVSAVNNEMYVGIASVDATGAARTWTEDGAMTERIESSLQTVLHLVAAEEVIPTPTTTTRNFTITGSVQDIAIHGVMLQPTTGGGGGLTADAYITLTFSGSFTADAIVKREGTGSFTADADITTRSTPRQGLYAWGWRAAKRVAPQARRKGQFAVTVVEQTGAFTANAVVLRTIAGSLTADAVVRREQTGSFTADADITSRRTTPRTNITALRIWRPRQRAAPQKMRTGPWTLPLTTYTSSFTADAVIRREQSGTFTANAVVLRTQTGTFTADAVITLTFGGSLTANAVVKREQAGSFTADAVLKRTISGTFTADAVVRREQTGSFTADADITMPRWARDPNIRAIGIWRPAKRIAPQRWRPLNPTFLAGTTSASFTADAIVLRTASASIGADAVIKREQSASFTADAVIVRTTSGSFTADAVVKREQTGAFTADAVIVGLVLRPRQNLTALNIWRPRPRLVPGRRHITAPTQLLVEATGSFTADAVVKATISGSFTADAAINTATSGQITVDAVIFRTQSGSFAADAEIVGPTLGVRRPAFRRLQRLLPAAQRKLHPTQFVVTYSASFTADAIVRREAVGSFTADAVILRTQSGSFTADAVVLRTFTGTFAADAVVKREQTGTLTTNAVIRREGTGSFTADAVVAITTTGAFTADADISARVLRPRTNIRALGIWRAAKRIAPQRWLAKYPPAVERTGSFTADAIVLRTTSGTFTADAVVLKTISGTFTADANITTSAVGNFSADAVIKREQTGSLTADAVVFRTQSASITADAVIRRTGSQSFDADAVVLATRTASLAANAVVLRTQASSFSSDAVIFRSISGSFTADAVTLLTSSGSFSADAVIKRTIAGSATADAVLLKTQSGSFTADAFVAVEGVFTFSADAVILVEQADSFDADATIDWVARAYWTTPVNVIVIPTTPTLAFTMPTSFGPMHFQMQLDKVDSFDGPNLQTHTSYIDQTGWEYWDGAVWQPVPQSGVPNSFSGNEARYTLQTPLSVGTWYRRVRAGSI